MTKPFSRATSADDLPRPSISLFLPAWNEEESLERAVSRAVKVLPKLSDDWELIIVDDASTDRTPVIAESLAEKHRQVRVVHAQGSAIKSGLAASTKDFVVWAGAELPFDLEELERALRLMDAFEADLICAFRFDRDLASYAYDALIRAVFDVQLKDLGCAFKVMHRRVLESIELKSTGAFIDVELAVKAVRGGFRVAQLGVDWFPRTRPVSPPLVMALRELRALYAETKAAGEPLRPVRLPPTVRPLRRKVAG